MDMESYVIATQDKGMCIYYAIGSVGPICQFWGISTGKGLFTVSAPGESIP